ncbi:MAG: MBOAT family protein, partial [Flavobacteriales bacterium]|nr:MBOAT family protein [Flavobacteriales bacterium]
MLFNSIEFAIFIPLVFVFFWLIPTKNIKLQNVVLLIASYVFYSWWDWRFLSLIIFSSFIDYLIGIKLGETKKLNQRKLLLMLSIVANLGFLGFFKYYNFFVDSFSDAFTLLGGHMSPTRLNIILPVGISFYTFQTLSYSIDIYKRRITPTKDIIAFFTYVSFFPQLVAGPIERAQNLLPQFLKKRKFNPQKATDALRQILWGLFKKIVIADNCAQSVDLIFNNSGDYSGSTLLVGAILFSLQIYGDFSGYSDIAIGTARLFGFNLKQNFAFPYFSRDIAEFWRRWHISLSTWFRDYLYIPIGGNRGTIFIQVRNIFVIFIVSGFWHGSNWNFIVWGILNALYFLPLLLLKRNRNNLEIVAKGKLFPSLKEISNIFVTFCLVSFSWIFFRSETIGQSLSILSEIISPSIASIPEIRPTTLLITIFLFVIIEWLGRENQFAIEKIASKFNNILRWIFYLILIISINLYSV